MRLSRLVFLVAALPCACSTPASTPNGGAQLPDGGISFDVKLAQPDAKPSDTLADSVADSAIDVLTDTPPPPDGAACNSGEIACFNDTIAKACVDGQWVIKAKCDSGQVCKDGNCATPVSCTPNESQGCDGFTTELVCSADGTAIVTKKCSGKQQCAAGLCRDVVCTPGVTECTDANSFRTCTDDGQGFGPSGPCKSGASCFGGKCLSLCESNLKVQSNIGCEYWSTDLDNEPDVFSAALNPQKLTPEMIPHSIVISNPGIYDADLTFTVIAHCADASQCAPVTTCGGLNTVCKSVGSAYDLPIANATVAAGKTQEFKMPVLNVDGSGISHKGIHIKSSQPVVAYQFNPFNAEGAASNDGSLLLPQNVLGKLYFGVSRISTPQIAMPGLPTPSQHGYVTVLATVPGKTTVTVVPTTETIADPTQGVPQDGTTPKTLTAGTTYTFALQQYDVLNLESLGKMVFSGPEPSLTGTRIEADKPIAVFGGHEETVIGIDNNTSGNTDSCCAEHIEEQLMPVESWGTEALCTKTSPRGTEPDEYIVVAGADNVVLKTTPSIAGLDGKTLAKAGNSVRVQTKDSFQLQATGKIEVVQFIVSRGQTEQFTGDPTMMIVPPKSQYRADYVIQTAKGYAKNGNWTSIVRPKGVAVTMDGAPIPDTEFAAFGDGTWELAWHSVDPGTHSFASMVAFGLMVYGYGNATAYGYPGGMNLQ